jgi:hypothetical protein
VQLPKQHTGSVQFFIEPLVVTPALLLVDDKSPTTYSQTPTSFDSFKRESSSLTSSIFETSLISTDTHNFLW